MPKIAVFKFLTFFIYAFDALHEPPHLHVVKEKGQRQRSAKIWIESGIVAESGTLSPTEINLCLKLIETNKAALLKQYENVSKGKKIKTISLEKK